MKNKFGWITTGLTSLVLATMACLSTGCSMSKGQAPVSAEAASLSKGPELWAQNCIRCHNSRTPSMYDDAQWEVISMHMRVRANLTAQDSREILAFLKSAH